MGKANMPFSVDHAIEGQSPHLEKVYFLPIDTRNAVIRIGQPGERDALLLPVLLEEACGIGAYCQDLCAALFELLVVVSQARQLRAAVGSHKTAQERQYHGFPTKIRQAYQISVYIA